MDSCHPAGLRLLAGQAQGSPLGPPSWAGAAAAPVPTGASPAQPDGGREPISAPIQQSSQQRRFLLFSPPSVITNNNIIPLIPPRGAGAHTRPGSAVLLPPLITCTAGAPGKTNASARALLPKTPRAAPPWLPPPQHPQNPTQPHCHPGGNRHPSQLLPVGHGWTRPPQPHRDSSPSLGGGGPAAPSPGGSHLGLCSPRLLLPLQQGPGEAPGG